MSQNKRRRTCIPRNIVWENCITTCKDLLDDIQYTCKIKAHDGDLLPTASQQTVILTHFAQMWWWWFSKGKEITPDKYESMFISVLIVALSLVDDLMWMYSDLIVNFIKKDCSRNKWKVKWGKHMAKNQYEMMCLQPKFSSIWQDDAIQHHLELCGGWDSQFERYIHNQLVENIDLVMELSASDILKHYLQ